MITLPTLSQLYASIRADLDAEFGISISLKKKVALRAEAMVNAGKLWIWYKALGFVLKNIWPDTADSESKGGTLERFGRIKLGRNPQQPVAGQYVLTVTGNAGSTIPAVTQFKADDTSESPGQIFILDNAYVLTGSGDIITVRATVAGTASKLAIGDTLTCVKPLVNISQSFTVQSVASDPLAAEDLEDYRAKILNAFRLEPQGGSASDYRIWSSDAQGVKTVYPFAKPGETNANNIYIEANIADSVDGKGMPTGAIIIAVTNVCELNPDTSLPMNERGRRPNTVKNYYLAVSPKDIDIDIAGFTGVTVAQQALILSALTNAINQIRPFVAAADPLVNKNDIIDINKINGYIYAQIPGAVYSGITLEVNGVPLTTYTFVNGDIPFLNSVTYS
jgi:hypothetical protein